MDTATQLLMVASLARSAAGGQTETKPEVNRHRAQVVIGEGFVPEVAGELPEGVYYTSDFSNASKSAEFKFGDPIDPYAELKAARAAGKEIEFNEALDGEPPKWVGGDSKELRWIFPPRDYRVKPDVPGAADRRYDELKQAWALGKTIQVNVSVGSEPAWHNLIAEPMWNLSPDRYRVVGEDKVVDAVVTRYYALDNADHNFEWGEELTVKQKPENGGLWAFSNKHGLVQYLTEKDFRIVQA